MQGRRRFPYQTDITVPPFTKSQKTILTRKITANTLLLTRLLNRELPPELNDIAKQKSIRIFPESWDDLDMSCNCPDWAVPCKHLAAVIYIIANEIDKDPFLIFALHDYPLIQALEDKQLLVNQAARLDIPKMKDLIHPEPVSNTFPEVSLSDIDYSKISNLKSRLLALLSPRPLFFEKDFKTILKTVYTILSRSVSDQKIPVHESVAFPNVFSISEVIILLDDRLVFKRMDLRSPDASFSASDPGILLHLIENVESKQREWLYPVMAGLYELRLFVMHCLTMGAFIPQLIVNDNHQYRIRWIPALLNDRIQSLFEALVSSIPQSVIQIETSAAIQYQSPREQALSLFSLFTDEYILASNLYEDLRWRHADSKSSQKILDLFFDGRAVYFEDFQEREIPQTIQQWINKLYITHRAFVPLIKIIPDNETFIVDLFIEDKDRTCQLPLKIFLTDPAYQVFKYEILRDLDLLSEHFPQLAISIQTQGKQKITFHAHDFPPILIDVLPVIRMLGIRILMPKSLKTFIRPKLSVQLRTNKDQISGSSMDLNEVLAFDWKVALGDDLISFSEFREAVQKSTGLIKINDQYVLIDQKEIERLLRQMKHPPELDSQQMLKTALTEIFEDAHIGLTPEVRDWLKTISDSKPVPIPEDLTATLRPYQIRGFEWMIKNAYLGFGSLLADDMGLGKTIQVLTALLHVKNQGLLNDRKALIVVPTTLITNWVKEIRMFTPGLSPFVYHGQKRQFKPGAHDCVITSYGILRNELKTFEKEHWYILILDEAQNIKNPGTAQTRAAKKIKAEIKIAMSGTPVENRLSEYWSILDFTNKGYLGSLKRFNDEFARPIQLDHNHEKIEVFRKMTSPFILRRVKTDKSIIHDLPEKVENNLFCNLTRDQAVLYQSTVNTLMEQVESLQGVARRGLIFKLMTALKQICNHPFNYLKSGSQDPDRSGKLSLLWNLLETLEENHEKVLIFTQYREMGNLLARLIRERYGTAPLFLHGGTPRKKRDQMVDQFQTQRHIRTFILSLRAGGTGLNLTAAQNVVHYDLWWNPAVENQATDRAYRIGQTKNVMVYRLLTEGTFEERINQMLQEKKWLAETTVNSGETWIGDLSDRELRDLVMLE
ncbi:DEAD/DEAH box helicase [bacterium]|nr:DEAD/DEAH box helicase [bacterium]